MGEKMKNFGLFCIIFSFLVLMVWKQEADGLFFGAPRNNCSNNRQCRKTWLRRRVTNVFCSGGNLIRRIFGRRRGRNCSANQCAQCTRDSHCSYNQQCSGYSCVSRSTSTLSSGRSCSRNSDCFGSSYCRKTFIDDSKRCS